MYYCCQAHTLFPSSVPYIISYILHTYVFECKLFLFNATYANISVFFCHRGVVALRWWWSRYLDHVRGYFTSSTPLEGEGMAVGIVRGFDHGAPRRHKQGGLRVAIPDTRHLCRQTGVSRNPRRGRGWGVHNKSYIFIFRGDGSLDFKGDAAYFGVPFVF